ncbi:MAG TPA: CPBP family glutamic-type intramembrane protease, partial [Abditibacteriaceae bacterium]|nr:CPBP family glutamic-type intramembrane protease [Abditibacteriaceae bacterium]
SLAGGEFFTIHHLSTLPMPPPRFHPFARLAICVAGLLVAAVMVQGAIVAAAYMTALLMEQPPQDRIARLGDDVSVVAAILSLTYLSSLPWIWFCRRALDRRSFVSLGLRARRSMRDLGGGVLAGAATIGLLFTVLLLSGHVAIRGWLSPEAFELSLPARFGFLLLWLVVFCIVGFGEEILFRGYGLHNLAAWMGVRGAVVYQAIIFALVHLGNVSFQYRPDALTANTTVDLSAAWRDAWQAMPNIALVAIFCAICYLKTGSLWFPIGFHVAWNFCLGCLFSLPVSGLPVFRLLDVGTSQNHLLTGGSFGLEGSVLLVPILLTLIYLMVRQPDHPQAKLDLALLDPNQSHLAVAAILPAPAVLAADDSEAEPHQSRFKTTFRSTPDKVLRTDEGDSWRQLTRPIPTIVPAPRPPQAESTPAVSAPVVNAPEIEAIAPASPPQETVPEPPATEETVTETKPASPEPPPAPRKPPAPRW